MFIYIQSIQLNIQNAAYTERSLHKSGIVSLSTAEAAKYILASSCCRFGILSPENLFASWSIEITSYS